MFDSVLDRSTLGIVILSILGTALGLFLLLKRPAAKGRAPSFFMRAYGFAEEAARATAAALHESEPMALRHWEPTFRLIRRREADPHANCHGWTFAGGRYWIRSESVQAILDDNGYQPVDTPRRGDLIIYRNAGDTITHSGVVRVSNAEGLVLIESKWSWQGTFLHAPEDQPY